MVCGGNAAKTVRLIGLISYAGKGMHGSSEPQKSQNHRPGRQNRPPPMPSVAFSRPKNTKNGLKMAII